MAMGSREKDIKLLVQKFIKLVESLEPGERLSIKKVSTGKRGAAPKSRTKTPKMKTVSGKAAKGKPRR